MLGSCCSNFEEVLLNFRWPTYPTPGTWDRSDIISRAVWKLWVEWGPELVLISHGHQHGFTDVSNSNHNKTMPLHHRVKFSHASVHDINTGELQQAWCISITRNLHSKLHLLRWTFDGGPLLLIQLGHGIKVSASAASVELVWISHRALVLTILFIPQQNVLVSKYHKEIFQTSWTKHRDIGITLSSLSSCFDILEWSDESNNTYNQQENRQFSHNNTA